MGGGGEMNAIADVCLVPIGVGVSLSAYIAECQRIFTDAGLQVEMHANGTNLEGDWDAIMGALKQCHEALHSSGVPRVHTEIRIGTRNDRHQSMSDKVASVQQKMG